MINYNLNTTIKTTFAGDVTTAAVISNRTDDRQGSFHTQLNGDFTSITYSDGEHRLFDQININDNTKDKYRLDSSGTMRTRGELNIYPSSGSFAGTANIQLNPNGSAAFAGYILTGPNTGTGSDNNTGMTLDG